MLPQVLQRWRNQSLRIEQLRTLWPSFPQREHLWRRWRDGSGIESGSLRAHGVCFVVDGACECRVDMRDGVAVKHGADICILSK